MFSTSALHPQTQAPKPMPAPTKPARRPDTTQPLTVEAAGEGAEKAPAAPAAPTAEETVSTLASAPLPPPVAKKPPFVENADGSITIEFDKPVDVSRFGIPNTNTLNGLTLQPATWKKRRAAARRYPQNATPLDQDTCLISELSGYPEHILDEIGGGDMSLVQAALGKLLYSPRMFSEG